VEELVDQRVVTFFKKNVDENLRVARVTQSDSLRGGKKASLIFLDDWHLNMQIQNRLLKLILYK